MITKTKHIDINYRPLKKSGTVEVLGSVPDSQVYQADKKEYTPDYTLTPLTLLPRCNATDPSATSVIGNVNALLTNMKWYEIIGGAKKLIDAANTGYTITESGAEKGKILVKKNIPTLEPITLEFYAEYVNAQRKGEKYIYQYRHLLHSVDGSGAIPSLSIDSPSGGLAWNPCRDETNQTITAKLIVAGMDVTDSPQCKFFFYRALDKTNLQPVKVGGETDYEVVSLTKNKLTINRNYIGQDMSYVVKASYVAQGTAPDTPDSSISEAVTTIRRQIPRVEADFSGVPNEVPAGTTYIYPQAIIRDTKGEIPDAARFFRCTWYRQQPDGLVFLATGFRPKLPYSAGMLLQLDVQDLGPYCLVTAGSGDARKLVKSNGKLVIAKKLQP